jgi:hypothetical protein
MLPRVCVQIDDRYSTGIQLETLIGLRDGFLILPDHQKAIIGRYGDRAGRRRDDDGSQDGPAGRADHFNAVGAEIRSVHPTPILVERDVGHGAVQRHNGSKGGREGASRQPQQEYKDSRRNCQHDSSDLLVPRERKVAYNQMNLHNSVNLRNCSSHFQYRWYREAQLSSFA